MGCVLDCVRYVDDRTLRAVEGGVSSILRFGTKGAATRPSQPHGDRPLGVFCFLGLMHFPSGRCAVQSMRAPAEPRLAVLWHYIPPMCLAEQIVRFAWHVAMDGLN